MSEILTYFPRDEVNFFGYCLLFCVLMLYLVLTVPFSILERVLLSEFFTLLPRAAKLFAERMITINVLGVVARSLLVH